MYDMFVVVFKYDVVPMGRARDAVGTRPCPWAHNPARWQAFCRDTDSTLFLSRILRRVW